MGNYFLEKDNVLFTIIEGVLEDLEARKISLVELQEKIDLAPKVRDCLTSFQSSKKSSKMKVIAEVKRSSPSKGELAPILDPVGLAVDYQAGGAAAISVLTEGRRFKGSLADFAQVRAEIDLPMLRKDFIVTEYQVMESRAYGADIQLLIVAALTDSQLQDFYQLNSELGMATLFEIHTMEELERAMNLSPQIIGVNSRNLKNLEVEFSNFETLIPQIPDSVVKIAESGISSVAQVKELKELGADVILVGESLVKNSDPKEMLAKLCL